MGERVLSHLETTSVVQTILVSQLPSTLLESVGFTLRKGKVHHILLREEEAVDDVEINCFHVYIISGEGGGVKGFSR